MALSRIRIIYVKVSQGNVNGIRRLVEKLRLAQGLAAASNSTTSEDGVS